MSDSDHVDHKIVMVMVVVMLFLLLQQVMRGHSICIARSALCFSIIIVGVAEGAPKNTSLVEFETTSFGTGQCRKTPSSENVDLTWLDPSSFSWYWHLRFDCDLAKGATAPKSSQTRASS